MDQTEHNELLTAFNHAAEELRFFKSQQWRVTNYVLLTDAALLTAPQLLGRNDYRALAHVLAIAIALGACWFGWTVLSSLDRAIDKERTRMQLAHNKLDTLWSIHKGTHATARYNADGLLRTALVTGTAIVVAMNSAWLS